LTVAIINSYTNNIYNGLWRLKGIAVRECGLNGVISIYKRKSPNPSIPLTVTISKPNTNHIFNRLWQFMESTVIRTVFIRSIKSISKGEFGENGMVIEANP